MRDRVRHQGDGAVAALYVLVLAVDPEGAGGGTMSLQQTGSKTTDWGDGYFLGTKHGFYSGLFIGAMLGGMTMLLMVMLL